MEDAVDALKLAAWVFVFILALSIVFMIFSQAREVSDIVLKYSDNTYSNLYTTQANRADVQGRVVGIETVVPTLYRYYKDKYSVDIVESGKIVAKFDAEIEGKLFRRANDKDYASGDGIYYADRVSWMTSKPDDNIKDRVTAYVSKNNEIEVEDIILKKYGTTGASLDWNSKFRETFYVVNNAPDGGRYVGEDDSFIDLQKGTTSTYIKYTKQ